MNQWIVSFELVLWEESSEWFSKNQMSFPVLRNQERVFCVSDYCLSLLGYKAACTMCIKNCFGSILLDNTTSDWRKQLYTGKPTVENIWKRKKKGRKETEKERQRESKIAEETLLCFFWALKRMIHLAMSTIWMFTLTRPCVIFFPTWKRISILTL